MDVETESANENDIPAEQMKNTSDSPSTPEKSKDTQNHKHSKVRRSSRSRTPQKKHEEIKILHISMKKIGDEVNGKDFVEEKNEDLQKAENVESTKTENGESKIDENIESNKGEDEAPQKTENGEIGKTESCESTRTSKGKSQKAETAKNSENGEPQKIESVRDSTSEAENDQEKPVIKDNGFKEDVNESQKDADSEKPSKQDSKDTEEMDPLVISDEVDLELQFLEENSDKESGKGSPVISRCLTRRSFTRNIPTPKTPKLSDVDPDSEKNSVVDHSEENICNLPNDIPMPKTENLIDTNDSLDTPNVSTKVEVGSDSTRLNYTEVSSSLELDKTYLYHLRDRGLSARRPIRGSDDYRKRVLKNAQNKSELNTYTQVSTGIKRKNRSVTPEEPKKFRNDSPGYKNFFTSPLASIRNKFRTDMHSSTPELLGYKDDRRNLNFNDNLDIDKIEEAGDDDKKVGVRLCKCASIVGP